MVKQSYGQRQLRSKPLFNKYNVLDIFDMYMKETAEFMYKFKNHMLPCSFDEISTDHKSNHNYNTRNNDDHQVPMHGVNNILDTGPKIWNNLPKYVKCSKSIGQFKNNIVSLLDDL